MSSKTWIVGTVVGAIGAVAAGAVLTPVRGWLGTPNVALVLVAVVVATAAIHGRVAGITTAAVAALSFNFFHTVPYRTFRIAAHEDVVTTIVLGVIGVAVGEMAMRARQSRLQARRRDYGLQRVHRVAELVVAGAPVEEIADAVADELLGELRLRDVGLVRGDVPSIRPVLEHNGLVEGEIVRAKAWGPGGLPPEGVELPLVASHQTLGRLVLFPTPGIPVSMEQRIVAVALADQLAMALAAHAGNGAGV